MICNQACIINKLIDKIKLRLIDKRNTEYKLTKDLQNKIKNLKHIKNVFTANSDEGGD